MFIIWGGEKAGSGKPQGVRYYFSPHQFVESCRCRPMAAQPDGSHCFQHRQCGGAARLSGRQKIQVPQSITKGADGSQWFQVKDPEGNGIEFVQPPSPLPAVAVNPCSGISFMSVRWSVTGRWKTLSIAMCWDSVLTGLAA
jgi:hypothetical protein